MNKKDGGLLVVSIAMATAGITKCVIDVKSYLTERKKRKMLEEELAKVEEQERLAKENAESWKIDSDAVEKLIEEMEKAKEQEKNDPNSELNRMKRLVKTANEVVEDE